MSDESVSCALETDYHNSNVIKLSVTGAKYVALRIPSWCKSFALNKNYTMKDGYAVVENDGDEIALTLDMTPTLVWANPRVYRNVVKVAVMRGPIVYCAEACDNVENLHSLILPEKPVFEERYSEEFGLVTLSCDGECLEENNELYTDTQPQTRKTKIKLIPYNSFANRGESNMSVWLHKK